MVRRHILAALDAGITAHDEDAARTAIRRIDPIARGFARRRLERGLIDAALACDAAQITAPPADHVMRLAALGLAKKAVDARDVEGTAAAYAQLPTPRPSRVPILTIASVFVVAAVVGFGALYVQHALEKPSRTYAKKLPPPSADAFAKGGVPLRDPAVDKLLTEELTKLVVEGGKAHDHEMNSVASVLDGLYNKLTFDPLPAFSTVCSIGCSNFL